MTLSDFNHEKLQNDIADVMKWYAPISPQPSLSDIRLVRFGVTDDVNNIFKTLKAKGEIHDFRVVCDETNNPPSICAEGKLVVSFFYYLILPVYSIGTKATMDAGENPSVVFDQ